MIVMSDKVIEIQQNQFKVDFEKYKIPNLSKSLNFADLGSF